VARAVDLERQLQVDKKLAWRVFRLVNSSGLREAANVPGRPAMKRLLASAEASGAPGPVIRRIADASERFERFATMQGGNREEMISLMVRMAGETSDSYELRMRKSFFRAAAHMWGVQAQMQVRTMIQGPVDSPQRYRGVLVAGDIGLQRRDPMRPLVVSARLEAKSDETPTGTEVEYPDDGPPRVELLTEYCSQPLPQMVPQRSISGHAETEMVFPVSGRAGAITLYTSRSVAGVDENPVGVNAKMFVAIPAESVIFDLVVPAGQTDPASARVAVYGRRHHPEHVLEQRPSDLFPQQETVTYLGAAENIPAIAGAPRHHEAVREVLQRYGWLGARFDIYRCRVQFPVLHTLLALRVDPRSDQ
jgi:hypothetical protein